MSTIGRIFSVLNVILAAAFLGFASTNLGHQQNWKKKHEDLQATYEQETARLGEELSQVRQELQVKTTSLTATDSKLQSETSAHEGTRRDLDSERQKNSAQEARLGELAQNLSTYNGKLEDVNGRAQAAETRAQEAIDARYAAEQARDTALAAQTDAETALEAANKQIGDLEIALTSEKKERTKVETSLASLVAATGVSLEEIVNQPDVRGAVMAVSTAIEPGLVSINRGAADGIKRGMTFEIFNGGTYKGTVKVESVRDNMCTGIITRAVPGTTMTQGDGAATRI